MNQNVKSIFLLLGLLCAARLDAMTPEDVQARKELVEGRLGKRGLDTRQGGASESENSSKKVKQDENRRGDVVEAAQASQQPEASSVLGKRDPEEVDIEQSDSKKPKHEEKCEEAAVVMQPADPNQLCGFAELPPEILSIIAGNLDLKSYRNLKGSCRFFDHFLNDEREIKNFINREIVARGHKNITGPVCSYISELFDVQPRNLQGNYSTGISVIELRDGNLASYLGNSKIKIWNSESAECLHTLEGHTSPLDSVIELSSGNLASCSSDGTIKIWNPNSGECLRTLEGHTCSVHSVIELSNGNLASYSGDRTIKIWNPNSGECLRTLEGHTHIIYSVIELRDGNLASCSGDETIKIWNPECGECLRTLEGHDAGVKSVIELRNGCLASCSWEKEIKIWDQKSGQCLCTLEGHTGLIRSVIELRDGNLASCSDDETIKIWNQESAECLRTLEGHTDWVSSVIELRNGNLASSSWDKTIKIWNPNTGNCLSTLKGHDLVGESVIELSNGNLASCSRDKTIKIWNLYPEDLSAQQIYLALRLDRCARHNGTIKLNDFWAEIFNSLPDYLKIKYEKVVE